MVYCIKRQISKTFITIQGDRSKPAILAFNNKFFALNIARFYKDLQTSKQQEIVIEEVDLNTMARMCTNVALDLYVMDQDQDLSMELKPDNAYMFMLDHCFRISPNE